jgi:hypothetical protein
MKTEPVPPPAGRPWGPGPLSAAESLAAYGPETLADAQLLEVLLEEPSLMRAAGLLEACGGLGNLLGLGPADLMSLGLTGAEAARVGVLVEVQRRRTRVHRARVLAPGMAWVYLLPKTAGLNNWHRRAPGIIPTGGPAALPGDPPWPGGSGRPGWWSLGRGQAACSPPPGRSRRAGPAGRRCAGRCGG